MNPPARERQTVNDKQQQSYDLRFPGRMRFLFAVLWLLMLVGCSYCKGMGYFHTWETADRVLVKVDSGTLIRTISARTAILELAKFAEADQAGWSIRRPELPLRG